MKTPADIQALTRELARASCANPRVVLRAAGGAAVTDEMRDEMLARCARGDYVELELEVYAYEQKAGVPNRNFVRFRDGALMALGRSGVNTPFMRDHDQDNALARGGTILESATEKRGEGDYAIRQLTKLTAPWAVELALRGLLTSVSIGWNSTGEMHCSICNADFYRCSHYPGQRYAWKEMEDGSRRAVRDPNGPLLAELVYTNAELVETSAVSVPAVPAARIEAIRAALAAHNRGPEPQRDTTMNPQLLALLGLAATAGDHEVTKAVESLQSAKKTLEQQRDELARELVELRAKSAGYEQVLAKQTEDRFIDEAVRAGKVIPGSQFESALRAYHGKDPEGAKALLASSPVVTQVGQPRQSGGPAPADPKGPSTVDDAILRTGGDPKKVRASLAKAGFTPDQIEKQLAMMAGGKEA